MMNAKRMKHIKPSSLLWRGAVYLGTLLTAGTMAGIVGYILFKGVPSISLDLFAWKYTADNVSLMPALITTLMMTALALVVAVPLGIFAAIYLAEYTGRGNRLVKLVRVTAETLAGIPSIIYGLFGMLFFVKTLKLGLSVLSGAFTISIMSYGCPSSEGITSSIRSQPRAGGFGSTTGSGPPARDGRYDR